MKYESTGEVRVPRPGEYWLCQHRVFEGIQSSPHPDTCTEVIMRPVREEEPTETAWCAIIPFSLEDSAREMLTEIKEKLGYLGLVKELELTSEELQ